MLMSAKLTFLTGIIYTRICSSASNRYIKGQLPKHNVPTIGVEFATKVVTLSNGANVKAQIWDTGIIVSVGIFLKCLYSWTGEI